MRAYQELRKTVTQFGRDRRGNLAVLAGVLVPVVLVAAGFAVDIAQLHQTRSNLLNALDAAVTSTARDITTGKITTEDARASVERFLVANGTTGFARNAKIKLDSLIVDKKARTVEASASLAIKLAFPIFNVDREQKIATSSAAVYSDKTIEVAMMLDVTGSMRGRKLEDLKAAAKNAVRLFLEGQNPANPRVRVAIVPYATAVNTGPLHNTVFVERKGGTNVPPGMDDPLEAATAPDRCATERKNSTGNGADLTDASPYSAKVNRDDRLTFCPSAALLPLTGDRKTANATIDSFRASGYTAGHIGIQWAWYMLSPNWKKVLTSGQAPTQYKSKRSAKYAILMTDGEFNTAYAGVAEGRRTDGAQGNRSRNYAQQLCAAMKKKGIEVFTIGFMLKERAAKDVMRVCASRDTGRVKHYYEAANGEALSNAFAEIASNIERLAITK